MEHCFIKTKVTNNLSDPMFSLLTGQANRLKRSYLFSLISLCSLLLLATVNTATPKEPDGKITDSINDFKTCALTSIKRTPQLQRSRMEIDLQRLNEDDSKWSFSPKISLSGSYYFSEDDGNITINVSSYKPWESYYSIKTQELISQIVILNHIQTTSVALRKLAETLLQIIVLDQIDKQYKQIIDLYARRINFAKQRLESTVTTPLEVELEQKTRDFILAEQESNLSKRGLLLQGLRLRMDLPKSYTFQLDIPQTLDQILGPFQSQEYSNFPEPEQTFNQKIFAIKLKLQEKKITLAYSKYLPSFSMGIRSPDIINVSVDDNQDYFFYAGLDLTLWDGNKRARDITRQKMTLRQMGFEKREIENNDSLEWLQAQQNYTLAKTEYGLAKASENLELKKIRKKELDYHSGSIQLPDLLNEKISFHKNRIRIIGKKLLFYKAGLQLRHLSGKLLKETVSISYTDYANE